MADRVVPLPAWWILGTFHAVALLVALIWLAYPGGGLGGLLAGLNKISGIALFVALWAIALFTTRRALRGLDVLSDDASARRGFYWRALRWGAASGALFLAALAAIALLQSIVASIAAASGDGRGPFQIQAAIFIVLIYGTLGTLVASAVGAVVGLALATLDIVALNVARALTRN